VGSIAAFSLYGIRVRVDPSWFIAFLLFAWTLSASYFPMQAPDHPAATYWVFGTLSALGLFGSVLAHELSHCLVARRLGIQVRQITLFIFGGVSEMAQTHSTKPATEFRIAVAGPLTSIGLGVLFLSGALALKNVADHILIETFHYLYYVNFLLAAFNLIPGFPLDGGRVLRSYLWHRNGNLGQATRTSARVGELFATGLMTLGLATIILFRVVLPAIWLILIGLFLKRSAEAEYRSFEVQFGLRDMTLHEIMAPAIALDRSLPISQFVNDYVFHYHYRVFPVIDNGLFAGMIDVRAIKGVSSQDWPTTPIGDFLSEPSTYCVLSPDMAAPDALRVLMSQNCNEAPIVRDGVIEGMLTRSDLFKLISLKSDLAA
jgi:Zn-dependent protease